MTTIFLHDYVEQVEKLIDDLRLVEAIEHCRHILHHFPRHIDTYRVMGKALLEKQDYDAASDLFLRILCADPNDFISHVGLSIVYKEENQLEQALWHLERAYEIQPYNVAIQNELRQLYADQNEARPGVIPLTRGALARLYMKGELYQQAISELRRILAEDPSRMDLQVLLAEAYWRDDQRIDAEEVCLNVLSELPNCIVINAILSEIWLQTGRVPEAQKYLQRLLSLTQQTKNLLNKETIAGKAFATEGAFPLPDQAALEFLETGMALSDMPAVPTDDWVGEVQFDKPDRDLDALDAVVMEPESGMHSYDWLADIDEMEDGETAVAKKADSETDWFSQDRAKSELNISTGELNAEWLADLRGEDEDAEFQPLELDDAAGEVDAGRPPVESDWFMDEADEDEPIAAIDSDLEPLPDEPATSEEAEDENLDWLEALADEKPPLQIDSTNLMDSSLSDWGDEEDDEPHVVQEPKTPFWLSEMADEALDSVQLNPEDALDWLADPTGKTVEAGAVETAVPPSEIDADQDQDLETPEADGADEAEDWLAALSDGEFADQLEEDGSTEDEPAETIQLDDAIDDELAALSDADDWMESAAADLDAMLELEEVDEEEFPNLTIPEMEGSDITEIPEWLDNENIDASGTDLSEESEAAVSSEKDPQETPQAEESHPKPEKAQDEVKAGSDASDWLDDLLPDSDVVPLEPPIDTEGMPSWMASVEDDDAVEVVDEWDSQSADIPGWLQEPVDLSDLDDEESLLETADGDAAAGGEAQGLTGLLAEMETKDEAMPLENLGDMESLFSDWVDEDDEGSLADLVDELGGDAGRSDDDSFMEDIWEETAASEPVAQPGEPEEVGLTGLLANLNIEAALPDGEADEMEEDYFADLLAGAAEDDLDEFLSEAEDTRAPEAGGDDALSLEDVDLENVSLTQLLSEAELPEEVSEIPAAADIDADDWLSDLAEFPEAEDEPAPEVDEEVGLTGMLATLWEDEEEDAGAALHDLEDEAADEMSLTELLAGIDYAEDAIDSEPDLPDFDAVPDEPPLTEIITPTEPEEQDLPVSAEDTTWLMQLEEDTGSLQERADEFDMAEETGLDWLTVPEEIELDEEIEPEVEAEAEAPVEEDAAEEDADADGTAEDWEDPMSWLEELAAQQDDPVGELPSVAETMLDEELDTAVDRQTDSEEESGLDWLTDLTEEVDLDVVDEADLPEIADEEADQDQFDLDDLADADEELSWLDELATGRLAGSESEESELDTEPVTDDEPLLLGDDSWLDEMAPIDEAMAEAEPQFEDLPETLDEVEDLAAVEQYAVETDLDWLDTAVDEVEEVAQEIDTAVPDEEEKKPLSEEDYKVLGVTDALKESSGIEEAEADLEEALAWLDELDEEDEAKLTEEAAPTLMTPTSHDEDWEDEPAPVVAPPEPDELSLALDRLEQQVRDEGVIVPETAVLPLLLSSAELNDALDWIEEMEALPAAEPVAEEAAGEPETDTAPAAETAVADVLPAEAEDEIDLAAMADDPEAWLEQLLSDDVEMDVEMEPPPIKPSEDAVFVTDDAPEAEAAAEEEADVLETAGIEEAEVGEEDALFEDVTPDEVPEDPDAAIAWLDQLVSGEDELDIEMEPPPIKPSEDAVYGTDGAPVDEVDQQETAVPEMTEDALDFDLEDDPEAWLEQMLGDEMLLDVDMEPPPIRPSEDAMYVTDDAQTVDAADAAVSAETAEIEDELSRSESEADESDIIADVPEDPDEAMAWLEQLAARQGADLEELPSVTDVEAEPEMPGWMAADLEELAAEPDLERAESAQEDETAAGEEAGISIDTSEIRSEVEDIDSELPDWLDEVPEEQMLGQTDWLRALPEVDVDTWLSAEEEATRAGATEEVVLPDTGPLTPSPTATPDETDIDEDVLFEPVLEPSSGAYSVDESKLAVAQEALADGRINDAIAQYKELLAAGSGMMSMIAELEQAAQSHTQAPALMQVLGDAYMRNGQLQKALASYRAALDQM